MNILLTGGAGYIGSHTAVELISAGHRAIIADNFSNSSREVMKRLKTITGLDIPLYDIDVADRSALRKVFTENKIDAAVHFAGYKAVGESVSKPLMYYRNNLDTVLSLLEVMAEFDVNKIIFSSSATVYGKPEALPLVETMKPGSPENPYGRSKMMIEQILTDAAAANPKLSAILLRYFNPIGAHESGLIGEAPSGIPNNLMPYITQVAVGKREKLLVFGNDYATHDGTGVRDYIHVVDLARGHVAAVNYNSEGGKAEIFNLGTGVGYSVLDIVNAFIKVNGVDIPYKITDRRPGDIDACYADAGKAKRLLGWEAVKTLENMCADSWNWQKNNPHGYR